MAKNRVIYQSEGLLVGPTPATGQHYAGTGTADSPNLISGLYRIQDISYGFTIPRTDVNQFGELAPIDRIILEQPTVNLNFSYLQNGFWNEKVLGFTISSGATEVSAISGFLNKTSDNKNYFIPTVSEGSDLIGTTAGQIGSSTPVIGVGNGFLSSYSAEGAVGQIPRCSISVQALNMEFEASGSGNFVPAVNPSDGTANTTWRYNIPIYNGAPSANVSGLSALRPGDITLSLGGWNEGGADTTDWKIQSYQVGFDLALDALQKLGSKYAFSREPRFPVPVTMTVTANLGDSKSGSLIDIINNNNAYNLDVTVRHPSTQATVCHYRVKRAFLDSQEFSSSIGANKSVTLRFTSQVGGPQQSTVGLFLSGWN